ncbi:hypothetical protein BDV27DRAFT_66171 [Aspergillus caelatus]|uniref:Uncharacterized protein n=1 Tax=Aspergillus caelatus TaxID=61420 RepID=A0A5N6ZR17_9EURO|nr:uncharacterized protein BDV27DRAFT_66171 [Aspergillus caelatus]KAE8358620.1 hypothetical protein BDV27DRAFT_66171 [Aspergillus caelatus]
MIEGRSDRTVAISFFFFFSFCRISWQRCLCLDQQNGSSHSPLFLYPFPFILFSSFSFSSYFVWSRRAFSVYWSSQCLPYRAFYDYLHSTQLFMFSCWILESAPCGC